MYFRSFSSHLKKAGEWKIALLIHVLGELWELFYIEASFKFRFSGVLITFLKWQGLVFPTCNPEPEEAISKVYLKAIVLVTFTDITGNSMIKHECTSTQVHFGNGFADIRIHQCYLTMLISTYIKSNILIRIQMIQL